MAVYLEMIKKDESDEKVVYEFGPSKKYMGLMEFDKINMDVDIIKGVNDGIISNEAYENWAVGRIAKVLSRENSIFPDIMYVEK